MPILSDFMRILGVFLTHLFCTGKPLNLTCRIRFGPESCFNPVIKWKSMYPNYEKEHSGGKELW